MSAIPFFSGLIGKIPGFGWFDLERKELTANLFQTYGMKKLALTFLIVCVVQIVGIQAQNKSDSQLAKPKLESQIRKYWFVMLLKGENRNQDSATAAKIQQAHLANINRLYNEGKIKVAGPFGDNGNWLGIFIFDCETKEEVETLLKTDLAVSSGRLAYDVRPWYTAPIGSFEPGKPKSTY